MNFRSVLKMTIRDAQKNYPQASVNNRVSDWFSRNDFVRARLKPYGLTGDFSSLMEILRARDTNGRPLKGTSMKKIGKGALKQGKVADLRKMRDFFVTGMGIQNMKFEGKSVPIYNVNKAIQFNNVFKN